MVVERSTWEPGNLAKIRCINQNYGYEAMNENSPQLDGLFLHFGPKYT